MRVNREITENELENEILPSIMERGYWFSPEVIEQIFGTENPVEALRQFITDYAEQEAKENLTKHGYVLTAIVAESGAEGYMVTVGDSNICVIGSPESPATLEKVLEAIKDIHTL